MTIGTTDSNGRIPGHDAWLWENDKALGMVMRGLRQAQEHQFAETPPDLDSDEKLAADIDDITLHP